MTARTKCLLDWLKKNPADCQKLFSDSMKDAKDRKDENVLQRAPNPNSTNQLPHMYSLLTMMKQFGQTLL